MPEFGSAPAVDEAEPAIVVAVPVMEAVMPSILALFESGAPSTMTAVPRLFIAVASAVRRLRV